jgi:transaldolase
VFDGLASVGIDLDDVFETLETEGVDKFKVAWEELLTTVRTALDRDRGVS